MLRLFIALLVPFVAFSIAYSAHAQTCGGQGCAAQASPVCCKVSEEEGLFCSTVSQCQALGGTQYPLDGHGSQVSQNQNSGESNNTSSSESSGRLENPLRAASLTELLTMMLQAVVSLGTIFLVLMLVYVGFLFVAARGAPDKITKAREALLWTVIGGLLLLGAEGLAIVLQSTVKAL